MPAILIHDRLFVGHGVGSGAAAPAAVAGRHDSCTVVPAEHVEGNEDGKHSHEDRLNQQDHTHLAGHTSQSGNVDGHQHQSQIELQEHVLNGVHLRSVELDIQGLHHIAGNGAGKQTADELGHLDHGDVVQDAVDGHTQSTQQQYHAEHGDHTAVAQLVDLAVHSGLRFVVGVRLQTVAADEEGSHRTADEGTHHIAQGAGSDAHRGGGLRSTHFLDKDRTEGGSGSDAAGHSRGGALQSQEGIQADELAHQHAQNILQGNEQAGGNGDLQAQLTTGVADQLPAEAEAHAHKEDVLTQILNGAYIKGDGDEAAALQNSNYNGKQQAGHHRGGDREFPQQSGALDDGMSQEDHDGREAQAGQVLKLE